MYLLFLSLFFFSYPDLKAQDPSSYYQQHETGWHWYQNNRDEIPAASPPVSTSLSPLQAMKAYRQSLKERLDAAILDPSPDHMLSFLKANQENIQRAQDFSTAWENMLLTHPEFDPHLKYPAHGAALEIYYHEENQIKKTRLKNFAENHGLFYFYASDCAYCQKFSPLVKTLAQRYHIEILPISVNGKTLPEFPDSQIDQGQAEQFGIQHYPALLAVNFKTQEVFPISYGLTSLEEIEHKIVQVDEAWDPTTQKTGGG